MKTLRDVKCGTSARVMKLHGDGAVKRRIMDMGITKGTEVLVRKVAPLGDPLYFNVNDSHVAIRLETAKEITVTKM